ncbi:DUF4261 domain-containing protein [Rhodopirellula sp. JC740]|uniref:DUF4261 domain-containing protein n=1 Tax=Rhodopirellula halodulae TaxID=2894198 RepID=A0ABS8NHN1_9BACT|nr:DUF4261 domain-containing protein [Rhodopirellula sp. JC740]MCC9643041.1 DUF4261 domain-containing protein [Rhodopirellula sp. JC740]
MPQGFYTQCVVVLLRERVSMRKIAAAIDEFEPSDPLPATADWAIAGPSLVMDMDEDTPGHLAIDLVDHPWPDDMEFDNADSPVRQAWSSGSFGPITFPNSLQRALEQLWVWDDGKTEVPTHTHFLRIRSSYVLKSDQDDAPLTPENYEPFDELALITEVAAALAEMPQAIAYFNPAGETIRNSEGLNQVIQESEENDFPPLDLWANVRLYSLDDGFAAMDTVGNGQLDLPDIEALFFAESYDFNDVDEMLRLITCHLIESDEPFVDGDTVEGPGGRTWEINFQSNSITDPQRAVLRCTPQDDHPLPEQFQAT